MSTSTGIPTSTIILIAANTRIRLRAARVARGNGSMTLSTAKGSLIEIRTHDSNMVNQSLAPRIDKISEDKRLIQETEQVLTEEGKIHPVERQDPQLLTGEGETRQAGTPGVAEIRQRSNPDSRMPSTVQIEAETMPECPVIAEARVARVCPRLVAMVAVEVVVEEEVSPVAVAVEVEEVLPAAAVEVVAVAAVEVAAVAAEGD
jgi:hypothetical protein